MLDCSSYVAIVLDITGSMGPKIEGTKQAVQQLLPLLAENPELGVVIITFTEGGGGCEGGCYVSVDVFSKQTEADKFVREIKICNPPGHPGVSACGDGDGGENAKAALQALKELDGRKPTCAFLITDDSYHVPRKENLRNAKAEEEFLIAKGEVDTDFYVIFDSVLAHFDGNLVVVPIIYNFGAMKSHAKQAYGQVAMTSGSGVVIQPIRSTPRTLALTMGNFVTRLLGQLNGQTDLPLEQEMLADLRLLDTSGMTRIPRDVSTPSGPYPRVGDAGALFESAMTRAVTAFKVSWKRCVNVEKMSLLRQLVFGLTAAKFVLAVYSGNPIAEGLMQRLRESFPEIVEALPEQNRRHIKATPEVIEALAAELAAAAPAAEESDEEGGDGGEVADAITLETVRDTLEASLNEEIRVAEGGDVERAETDVDPLEEVFAIVHGVLVNVRFPPGANGKPNFTDAWSAMIDKHSFDVVSAESAVRLFKDGAGYDEQPWSRTAERGGAVALGLTDRREYNGFVPLMDEKDPLKTVVIRIFSGLQVMNLLQMTVLAGSPRGFLPNMYPGMVAATLARVIRTSAGGSWAGVERASGEANDRLASQMVFSLRGMMGSPAKTARLRLEAGKADPANPLSKFLMVLCKHPRGSESDEAAFRARMRLVLNEWVAATVQLYFGKATPENDHKFHAFLRQVVPLEVLFGLEVGTIDPREDLHPLEVQGEREGRGLPALDGWRKTGLINLSKTALYKDLKRLVDRCRVVFRCLDMEYEVDDIVLDYVIYRFRAVRYDFMEQPESPKAAPLAKSTSGGDKGEEKGTHEPIENMPSSLTLLIKIYRNALHAELAEMRESRRVHAINLLKAQVVSARTVTAETRSMELLGTTYSLKRTDVPALLETVGYDGNLSFVEDLVLGSWTPEPPQCLRRFSAEIFEGVEAAGGGGEGGLADRLRDAMLRQELCLRTVGCNRHGHTADLQFPGPMGWTKDYAETRCANLEKKNNNKAGKTKPRRIVLQMERYATFGAELLRRLDDEPDGVEFTLPFDDSKNETKKNNRAKKGVKRKAEGASREKGGAVVTLDQLKKDVRRTLYAHDDANRLPLVAAEIKRLDLPAHLVRGLLL